MPLRDKQILDNFFRNVCFLNGWSYTLLGSKPMSTFQYTKPWIAFKKGFRYSVSIFLESFCLPSFREICYLANPVQFKLQLGWNTLNKYIRYFPDNKFALFSYSFDNELICLALVDKKKLIKIVEQHREDFNEILQMQGIGRRNRG